LRKGIRRAGPARLAPPQAAR